MDAVLVSSTDPFFSSSTSVDLALPLAGAFSLVLFGVNFVIDPGF